MSGMNDFPQAPPDVEGSPDATAGAAPAGQPDVSQLPTTTQSDPSASLPQAVGVDQQPAPQKGGMWKAVLQGALAGLQGAGGKSFAEGVGRGAQAEVRMKQLALENQQAAALQPAKIKFANAQAAQMAAKASADDIRLHSLPDDIQAELNESAAKSVEQFSKVFGPPTHVVDNTGPDVKQRMEELGTVDHMFTINTGKQIFAWDTSAAAANGNPADTIDFVRAAGVATGDPIMANMTSAGWKDAQKGGGAKDMLAKATDILGNTTPDKNNYIGQMSRLKTAQQTLEKAIDQHPEYKPYLEKTKANYANVEAAYNRERADKQQDLKAAADTRNQSAEANRGIRVYEFNDKAVTAEEKPVKDRLQRMSTLDTTLSQRNPQADALIAPELLTTMAGGQGSGLRMNEAEISRIIGGRNAWEDIKAKVLRYQADPNKSFALNDVQRGQVSKLLGEVRNRLSQKQEIYNRAHEDLANASDQHEMKMIRVRALRDTAAVDMGRYKPAAQESSQSSPAAAPQAAPAAAPKGGMAAQWGVQIQ